MKKRILMPTIALLMLLMLMISPVEAMTKEPYSSHHELELIDPGEEWFAGGIYHIKGSYW